MGESPRIEVPLAARVWGHARALAETLVAPAVLLGVSLFGFVVMVGFAWLVGLAISRPLYWIGLPTLATILHLYIPASIFFVMTIGDMTNRSCGRASAAPPILDPHTMSECGGAETRASTVERQLAMGR